MASGINNTVARVAGLLAIAVFRWCWRGVRSEDAAGARNQNNSAVRAQVRTSCRDGGGQLDGISLDPGGRSALNRSIHESFLSAFRLVVMEAAVLGLAAAVCGAGIAATPRSRPS